MLYVLSSALLKLSKTFSLRSVKSPYPLNNKPSIAVPDEDKTARLLLRSTRVSDLL